MKKLLLVLLLALDWLGARATEGETVSRRDLSAGRGGEGLWVSDGVGFARTDRKGAYTLTTDADSRYVFVCVPAGYDAPVEGGVVRFHHPLPAGDAACDFTLLRRTGDDRRYNLAVIADPQIWFRKEFPQFEASMEDLARTVRSLGIPVKKLRAAVILAATLVTASVVSMCGLIGWVGLLVPHAARMVFGANNRFVIPASALFGALFMLAVDTEARTIAGNEIPVSILTALIGAPFFIYLLRRTGGAR